MTCYLMKAVTVQKSSLHSVATQSWLSLLSLSWTSGIMTTSATRLSSPELPLWDWLREVLAMLFILLTELRVVCLVGSKGSTTICSVPLISARQNGQPPPFPSESCNNKLGKWRFLCLIQIDCLLTCQAVRQWVHSKCPQGSILISLLFSAHILHSWKVEPISQ